MTDEAIAIDQEFGDQEGQLRSKSLKADFYDFVGNHERAAELSNEILPLASTFGYVRQVEAANDLLSGDGLRSRLDRQTEESEAERLPHRSASCP